MALDILIVDDEQDIRDLVSGVLEDEGFTTRTAADSHEALQALADRRPSLALLDVWLQGSKLDGLQLLEEIKRRDPTLPVLIISGHGNLDTAVAAIRQGAVDFIEKPFEAESSRPSRHPRHRDRAAQARECGAAPAGRQRDGADRVERGDQQCPRDAEARRRHRQPGADLRAGRGRQGSGGAAAPQLEPARATARSSSSPPRG